MPGDALSRLAALTHFLRDTRHLWHPRAFVQRPVPWEVDHPEVVAWLDLLRYESKRLAVHHPNWLVALPLEKRAAWSWWY